MALHHTAQGLASLGRNGDSVLVHMQPHEVAGLQALAQSQGTSLTINPDTGMPEAFRLGDFFSSLLPTAAGFLMGGPAGAALGLKGTAATLAPIAAGMATGAAVAGAKGEDMLMGTLMGGLGGYGGGNLGSAVGKMGQPVVPGGYEMGQVIPQGTPITTPAGMDALNTAANPFFGSANTMPSLMTNSAGVAQGVNAAAPMTYSQGLSQMGRGAVDILSPGGYDKFVSPEIGGSAMQLAMPIGGGVLAGLEPSDLGYGGPSIDDLRNQTKYRGPQGQLNLGSNYNQETGEYEGLPSLRLAIGGAVNTNPSVGGGISDLYNRPEGASTQPISKDDYGMGRLDRLAQQGSLTKAADMFYAAGGPVSFADGGDTEKGMNLDSLPTLNLNTGTQSGGGMGSMGNDLLYQINDGAAMSPVGKMFLSQMSPSDRAKFLSSGMGAFFGVQEAPKQEYYTGRGELISRYGGSGPQQRTGDGRTISQGMPVMARGGYLDGPGDGLSDSIPATIEGKQPARLADGEFVVSADVVSGLGNGSSKAGAKKLYAMMDKVRQQAHGTKKQIRKVNASKVMPVA